VVVGVIIAAVAYVGIQRVLDRPVEIPDSIAGVARMHDTLSKNFEVQMQTEAEKFDVDTQSAIFGNNGKAQFLVVVVDGSASETTDELFQSFVRGMTQGGVTVGTDKSQGELKDATYRCVGASGGGVHVGTCMWRAEDHVGFVLELDGDVESAGQLTSLVYRAID
jgi:hypothetical protein